MMTLAGYILAAALMAPPIPITDGTAEILSPQLHPKRNEVSWESLKMGHRTITRKHLKSGKITRLGTDHRPNRNLRVVGGRSVVNILTDSGRWALLIGNRETVSPSAASDVHGTLSPNGKKLALISGRTGNGDLYLANAKKHRQSPRRLTHTQDTETRPIWSPDGNTILLLRGNSSGRKLVAITGINAKDGRNSEQVIAEVTDNPLGASFSPSGKHIGFFGREWGVGTSLYVTPLSGGVRKVLDNVVQQESGPAWLRTSLNGDAWMIVVTNEDKLVAVHPTKGVKNLPVDTFGHGEVAAALIKGTPTIMYTALGRQTENKKIRKRKLFRWHWLKATDK